MHAVGIILQSQNLLDAAAATLHRRHCSPSAPHVGRVGPQIYEGENETWFIPLSFDSQSNRRAFPAIESR
jgi:hypothetical protein